MKPGGSAEGRRAGAMRRGASDAEQDFKVRAELRKPSRPRSAIPHFSLEQISDSCKSGNSN
jgi:hypothetical protein